MKVVVCCKAVPLEANPESLKIVGDEIHYGGGDLYTSEIDEYAIEAAVALKKTYGAETWAVTVGPLRAQVGLYIALAKGIENVARIDSETLRPELVANSLIALFKELKPDLVLVGVQSEDWMGGEVGAYVAEGLGASLGFAAVAITALDDKRVEIKKEIGGGSKVKMSLNLPAVLCVQSGIQPLQYISAMRRRQVRDLPIKLWGQMADLPVLENVKGMTKYQVKEISVPKAKSHARMIEGERANKAKQVVEIIRKSL